MPACSLNGAHNGHESHCIKTVTQINTWLVSIRFEFFDWNWKVSLWLYKALERTCFSLTCAQNSLFKQWWVNKNVIRTVTKMDIMTSRKTLRDHSLLKFKVALKTDTPKIFALKIRYLIIFWTRIGLKKCNYFKSRSLPACKYNHKKIRNWQWKFTQTMPRHHGKNINIHERS